VILCIKIKIKKYSITKTNPKKHNKIMFVVGWWSGIHRFLLSAGGLRANPCKMHGMTVLAIKSRSNSTNSLSPKLPSPFLSMLPHNLGQYFKRMGSKILPPVSCCLE